MVLYIVPAVFVLIALVFTILGLHDLGRRYHRIMEGKKKAARVADADPARRYARLKDMSEYYEIEKELEYP